MGGFSLPIIPSGMYACMQSIIPLTRSIHVTKLIYILQVTLLQWIPWIQPLYATGKTSNNSIFNIPGKVAWITMEVPGFTLLLYIMNTLPATLGIEALPLENKILGALFVSCLCHILD